MPAVQPEQQLLAEVNQHDVAIMDTVSYCCYCSMMAKDYAVQAHTTVVDCVSDQIMACTLAYDCESCMDQGHLRLVSCAVKACTGYGLSASGGHCTLK